MKWIVSGGLGFALVLTALLFYTGFLRVKPDSVVQNQWGNIAVSMSFVLRLYSDDFEGKYPETLEALIDENYLDGRSPILDDENGEPRWTYLGVEAGNSDPNQLLFHSVKTVRGKWIRGHLGGFVTIAEELDGPIEKIHRKSLRQ